MGHYDLGIFVASIVPGGPAYKDGRIRTGRGSCGHLNFELNSSSILLRFKRIDAENVEQERTKEDKEGMGGVCGITHWAQRW